MRWPDGVECVKRAAKGYRSTANRQAPALARIPPLATRNEGCSGPHPVHLPRLQKAVLRYRRNDFQRYAPDARQMVYGRGAVGQREKRIERSAIEARPKDRLLRPRGTSRIASAKRWAFSN